MSVEPYGYNIDQKRVKALSALTSWRTAAAILFDWAVIAATIWISARLSNPLVYVVALFIIGGRMHALGILIHEFAHYRFVADKKVSEWVGDICLAWPLGTTVDGYRRNHLAHHRYTNTNQDPDWVVKFGTQEFTFPQPWQYVLANLAGYFIGTSSWRDIRLITKRLKGGPAVAKNYKIARLSFYVAVAVALTLTGTWLGFLLYWIIPYFSALLMLLYIRSVAEHFGGMDYEHELTSSRTIYPHRWEKIFLAPHNVNYHLDHHLYPSVPFYNLPKLHALLMDDPEYRSTAHLTRGYSTGLVRECMAPAQPKPYVEGSSPATTIPAE
ncbi:MAG: fatty acid desaturase family protein [Rhizobiaceae bacterium]|nr:fatty acid desaturase family protein [Rhizobiaceae bacterium]